MSGVRVLTAHSNQAIVQLDGRQFPGSVIQGDSLSVLYSLACDIEARAREQGDEAIADTATELRTLLQGRLKHYDDTLREHGLTRPYAEPTWR